MHLVLSAFAILSFLSQVFGSEQLEVCVMTSVTPPVNSDSNAATARAALCLRSRSENETIANFSPLCLQARQGNNCRSVVSELANLRSLAAPSVVSRACSSYLHYSATKTITTTITRHRTSTVATATDLVTKQRTVRSHGDYSIACKRSPLAVLTNGTI